MIESQPCILLGTFPFQGAGYDAPRPIDAALSYAVPPDRRAQLVYFRAGTSCDQMVNFVLLRDGKPMRMFPVGARSSVHVPLVVVEDLFPETRLELLIAAPEGATGTVVVDLGLVEV